MHFFWTCSSMSPPHGWRSVWGSRLRGITGRSEVGKGLFSSIGDEATLRFVGEFCPFFFLLLLFFTCFTFRGGKPPPRLSRFFLQTQKHHCYAREPVIQTAAIPPAISSSCDICMYNRETLGNTEAALDGAVTHKRRMNNGRKGSSAQTLV